MTGKASVKVLFVIGSSELGGAESLILWLMQALPRDRFECHLVCPAGGPMVEQYAHAAARVVCLPYRSFLDPRAILKIAVLIRRSQIEIVHTCLYTSDVAGILAARLAGKAKVVSHLVGHNFYITEEGGMRRIRKRIFSRLYRGIYRGAHRVIAVCDAVKADLVNRAGLRVAAHKIIVLRHALPRRPVTVSAEHVDRVKALSAFNGQAVSVATIATLVPIKGHRYLLEAIARLAPSVPSLRCVLVGEGPERGRLEAMARALGLGTHVIFMGALEEELKNAVIHASRAIVVPSLSEGLPVAVLEAMAAGKPVVACDAGGVREIITDGVTGCLVPSRDPDALARAILMVISNEALADRLGRAGRRHLDERFIFHDMIAKLEHLYTTL